MADTAMPSRRSGSTCWSTRKRLDGAVRPDTMAATRKGGAGPITPVPGAA